MWRSSRFDIHIDNREFEKLAEGLGLCVLLFDYWFAFRPIPSMIIPMNQKVPLWQRLFYWNLLTLAASFYWFRIVRLTKFQVWTIWLLSIFMFDFFLKIDVGEVLEVFLALLLLPRQQKLIILIICHLGHWFISLPFDTNKVYNLKHKQPLQIRDN